MRRVLGVLAWVMWGGLACTVPELASLGSFPCDSTSACAPGYVCVSGQCVPPGAEPEPGTPPGPGPQPEPDAGTGPQPEPDAGTEPQPDAGPGPQPEPGEESPPTLAVSVPSPPSNPPASGRTTYTELGSDGRALSPAWKRDQQVVVEARTSASAPVVFELKGTDGRSVTVDGVPYTSGCAARQCVRATLPLWKPRMDAARGSLTLVVTARTATGVPTVFEQALPVTRWKWAYSVFDGSSGSGSNRLDDSPGIGANGTVYVTTYYTQVVAVSPSGRALWNSPLQGEGAPIPSVQADGRELLYVRSYAELNGNSGHQLYVYDLASRSLVGQCPSRLNNGLWFDSTVLGTSNGVENAFAVTYGSTGAILALGSGSSSRPSACAFVQRDVKSSERGNLAYRDNALFFSGPSARVMSFETHSFYPRAGWPVMSASASGANGLAFHGDVLVMGEGDASSTSSTGGISTTSTTSPQTAVMRYAGGAVSMPSVGAGGVLFGVDAREGRLVRMPTGGGSATVSKERGLGNDLAPTLGQGGLVYAMQSGVVGVWSAADLSLQWLWSWRGSRLTDTAPPVLDCTRDEQGVPIAGRPGVLYASLFNELHALVVDSAGLDADAPWPKQQHDQRNTGNASTPVLRCP
ncbi:hypothetical protein [Archangium primigenium]|uniref:hypothetical protein n=1 Tax=[Archangium] primigenium TaxID=2792470 RepID=UPI00195ADB16|nr:hypothetical protein [Archangium primigenium]MBM7115109.1 hypothetical protein [Archangium primigenium]